MSVAAKIRRLVIDDEAEEDNTIELEEAEQEVQYEEGDQEYEEGEYEEEAGQEGEYEGEVQVNNYAEGNQEANEYQNQLPRIEELDEPPPVPPRVFTNPCYQPVYAPNHQMSYQSVQREIPPFPDNNIVVYNQYGENNPFTRSRLQQRCKKLGCTNIVHRDTKGNGLCWHCNDRIKKDRQRVAQREIRRIDRRLEEKLNEEEMYAEIYRYKVHRIQYYHPYLMRVAQYGDQLARQAEMAEDWLNHFGRPMFHV